MSFSVFDKKNFLIIFQIDTKYANPPKVPKNAIIFSPY